MHAQLERLAELSGTCPWITVQILPFSSGAHPVSGPMTILRFPGAPSLGLVHLPILSDVCLTDQRHITSHVTAFAQLQLAALPPAESTAMLAQMAG